MLHWLHHYDPHIVFMGGLLYTLFMGAALLVMQADLWLWVLLLPGPLAIVSAIEGW